MKVSIDNQHYSLVQFNEAFYELLKSPPFNVRLESLKRKAPFEEFTTNVFVIDLDSLEDLTKLVFIFSNLEDDFQLIVEPSEFEYIDLHLAILDSYRL
jgi:hypothetical protein